MKNIFLNTLLILLTAAPTFAQNRDHKDVNKADQKADQKEKIKAFHTAFLTEQLEMTTDESMIFWAAHNELDNALEAIRTEKKQLRKETKDTDSQSEKDLKKRVVRMAELKVLEVELNRDFILSCFDILDPSRALKISKIEKTFRDRVKERLSRGDNSRQKKEK
jgi:hypothetical protein